MHSLLLGKNPIAWLAQTVKSKGTIRAIKLMWHAAFDATWDFVHGTETLTRIPVQSLHTSSNNKSHATAYGATRARPLRRLLDELDLPREGCFVDLGCGKGRVILIAAQYRFRKVIGVDFSEPLCLIARSNVVAFGRRRKLKSEINIVHADVVQYAIKSDDTIFFLYDPFSAKVLTQVLENIRQSLVAYPRDIWVIYNSPAYHDLMESCGLFTPGRHFEFGGSEFCVYGNTRGWPQRLTCRPRTRRNRNS